MSLPSGYELRPPTADDFDAVAALLVTDELDHTGNITLGADFLRAEWKQPGFDLATSAWAIVDATGTIVAYGQAALEEPAVAFSWGAVHPGHRGRGIGAALFERIAGWAPQNVRLRHAIYAGDEAAATILTSQGLQPVRHFWHMQIDLEGPIPRQPAPEGVDIAPVVSEEDLRAVHGVIDVALAQHFGHHSQPFEEWLREQDYAPGLWLLARVEGTPAGALTASPAEDRGWIDYLGVLEAYRGRGIAAALLHQSFAAFAERGLSRVLVSVDSQNVTGATAVYERAGMRVVKAWDMWERS